MKIRLSPDPPLDVPLTLARFRRWGEDPANRCGEGVFRRVLTLDGALHGYALRWSGPADDPRLTIDVPGSRAARVAEAVTAEVRRVLFLDADLPGFYRMAKGDPFLRELVPPLYGMRPTLAPAPFEMLVGAITAQQVHLAFALALRARLARRFGRPVEVEGETVYAFPGPEPLARARLADLRRMHFSSRKAAYVIGLARGALRGEPDLGRLAGLDNEGVISALTRLDGIGRWTAEWFLARALGRGDVCPAGDLAVRKAFARFYGRGRPLADGAIRRRAAAWGAYQNLAVHYLLAGLRLAAPRAGGGE
jgi:DNA-3-methyladenine glycosylase II